MTTMSDEMREHGDVDTDDLFPAKATSTERAMGFVEGVLPRPRSPFMFEAGYIRAVFCDLENGLRAIKTARPDGKVTYAIWNKDQRPVEDVVSGLDELRQRHPKALAWQSTHHASQKRCTCGTIVDYRLTKENAVRASKPFLNEVVTCPDARCGRKWKLSIIPTADGFNVGSEEVSPAA